MPAFHETQYGRRFFDGQLPRLIDALESIAESLARMAGGRRRSSGGGTDVASVSPNSRDRSPVNGCASWSAVNARDRSTLRCLESHAVLVVVVDRLAERAHLICASRALPRSPPLRRGARRDPRRVRAREGYAAAKAVALAAPHLLHRALARRGAGERSSPGTSRSRQRCATCTPTARLSATRSTPCEHRDLRR